MLRSKVRKRFMELYEPIHGRFERFCRARSYGAMDPKDLMHDSIVIALEKFREVKDPTALLSFLCGIAIRVLANQRRKMTESGLSEWVHELGTTPTVEVEIAVKELYAGLAKLPAAMGEALILFEITGFSIKEIAELQQSSEDAVKQRLARGRKQLALVLQDEPVLIEEK